MRCLRGQHAPVHGRMRQQFDRKPTRAGQVVSTPILDLDSHEGGAQASLRLVRMTSGERLRFLSAAVTALFTGNAHLDAPHLRTLHCGHSTRLRFDDRFNTHTGN
jgi:hypothetical protein